MLMVLIPSTLPLLYELLKMGRTGYQSIEFYWSITIFLAVTKETDAAELFQSSAAQ